MGVPFCLISSAALGKGVPFYRQGDSGVWSRNERGGRRGRWRRFRGAEDVDPSEQLGKLIALFP
jgi:hypothetical protein